jgi:hypothetical protein
MIIKKDLIKIESLDNDLFLFIADLLKRTQKKYPDYLEVVEVDESHQTILFMSSSYVGANVSRILMDQEQFFWHDQREDAVKVERLRYKAG